MRVVLAVMTLFACLFGAGCSSFSRQWETAMKQPVPADGIRGPWEGKWVSDRNGHTGRLRCVMTQAGLHSYTAHFHAVYWKILRVAYEVPFHTEPQDDAVKFSGEADLGKLAGGVYTYEGTATPFVFHAIYRCKYDHGRFEMSRPSPGIASP